MRQIRRRAGSRSVTPSKVESHDIFQLDLEEKPSYIPKHSGSHVPDIDELPVESDTSKRLSPFSFIFEIISGLLAMETDRIGFINMEEGIQSQVPLYLILQLTQKSGHADLFTSASPDRRLSSSFSYLTIQDDVPVYRVGFQAGTSAPSPSRKVTPTKKSKKKRNSTRDNDEVEGSSGGPDGNSENYNEDWRMQYSQRALLERESRPVKLGPKGKAQDKLLDSWNHVFPQLGTTSNPFKETKKNSHSRRASKSSPARPAREIETREQREERIRFEALTTQQELDRLERNIYFTKVEVHNPTKLSVKFSVYSLVKPASLEFHFLQNINGQDLAERYERLSYKTPSGEKGNVLRGEEGLCFRLQLFKSEIEKARSILGLNMSWVVFFRLLLLCSAVQDIRLQNHLFEDYLANLVV
ncbi:hypothetical protein PROFUN_03019 [Planoprotostelium fungivorum]|uniref:Uncharacterized protein n=1 Tax=Planoprotostelium fungivorum TaxID=1890364 RepID=A0A2P6NXH6_9EUKA|nr:hypothetical protein PROFUN_03019 [Planoprotostelium fungivorum]